MSYPDVEGVSSDDIRGFRILWDRSHVGIHPHASHVPTTRPLVDMVYLHCDAVLQYLYCCRRGITLMQTRFSLSPQGYAEVLTEFRTVTTHVNPLLTLQPPRVTTDILVAPLLLVVPTETQPPLLLEFALDPAGSEQIELSNSTHSVN